jgi:hypothetical protein
MVIGGIAMTLLDCRSRRDERLASVAGDSAWLADWW